MKRVRHRSLSLAQTLALFAAAVLLPANMAHAGKGGGSRTAAHHQAVKKRYRTAGGGYGYGLDYGYGGYGYGLIDSGGGYYGSTYGVQPVNGGFAPVIPSDEPVSVGMTLYTD